MNEAKPGHARYQLTAKVRSTDAERLKARQTQLRARLYLIAAITYGTDITRYMEWGKRDVTSIQTSRTRRRLLRRPTQ